MFYSTRIKMSRDQRCVVYLMQLIVCLCVFVLSFSPPYTELALYKLKLKQEGARRPSLTVQASSQVGLSYLPLQYLPDMFCMCYF